MRPSPLVELGAFSFTMCAKKKFHSPHPSPAVSPPGPATESPATAQDDTEMREKLYGTARDELIKKQISNAENFDKSVLTISSSALGFSVAFIKDLAPLATAEFRWALVGSWWLFGAAVILTIVSYMTSQAAIRHQLDVILRYYINREEAAIKEPTTASNWTNRCNSTAGIALVTGMVLTILFAFANLPPHQSMKNTPTPPSQPSGPAPAAPVQPTSIVQPGVTNHTAGQPTNQIRPVPTNQGK